MQINGRRWLEDELYVAVISPGAPTYELPSLAEERAFYRRCAWVRDVRAERTVERRPLLLVIKAGCAILATPLPAVMRDALVAIRDCNIDEQHGTSLRIGISHGYCFDWPTPVLREDVIGLGVTRAFRAWNRAERGECVVDRSIAPHLGLHPAPMPPRSFGKRYPREGVVATITDLSTEDDGHNAPYRSSNAVAAPPSNTVPPPPSIRPPTAVSRRALVIAADLEDSEALAATPAYRAALGAIRDAVRAHVPAVISYCAVNGQTCELTKIAEQVHFAFTGDGFELAVFHHAHELPALLDWLLTLLTDVFTYDVSAQRACGPLRIGVAVGQVTLREHPLGTGRSVITLDGPALDEARRHASRATTPTLAPCARIARSVFDAMLPPRGLPTWPLNLLEPPSPSPPEPDGCAAQNKPPQEFTGPLQGVLTISDPRPGTTGETSARVQLDEFERLIRGPATGPARRVCDWDLDQPPETERNPLARRTHRALRQTLNQLTRLGYRHAPLEVAITVCIIIAYAGVPSTLAPWVGVSIAMACAFLFAYSVRRYYVAYLERRVLPGLHRFHFAREERERATRSAVRLRAGLRAKTTGERYRRVADECGSPTFWLNRVFRLHHRPRRIRWVTKLRRTLPQPTFDWPMGVVAAVGVVAYGGVTLAIASWAYAALAWHHVLTAAALGALWNISLNSYIGQIAMNLLYLSPGGIRDIQAKLDKRVSRLARQWAPLVLATGMLVVLGALRVDQRRITEAGATLVGLAMCFRLWWIMAQRPGSSSEVSVRWLAQLHDAGLAADGTDIPELVPLTPLGAGIQVMVARGDLLSRAARWLQDLPVAQERGLIGEVHACFVSDRHGQIIYHHGDRHRLRLLGWDTAPVHVAQLYAEGRFAARIVGDFARHASHGQVVELELLGAGRVTTNSPTPALPVVPVKVQVIALNPDSLNAGYLGLVTMESDRVRFCPVNLEDDELDG